jgi:hypothetical protein
MIYVKHSFPTNIFKWFAKAGGVKAGQLVKHDSGATPVAAAHTGTTILGVAVETQAATNGEVLIEAIRGAVLQIDNRPAATKQAFAVTDLGTQYDIWLDAAGEMFVDPDDTTGGYMILVGYDNEKRVGYYMLESVDILGHI